MEVKIVILLNVPRTCCNAVYVRAHWRRQNGRKVFVRAYWRRRQ